MNNTYPTRIQSEKAQVFLVCLFLTMVHAAGPTAVNWLPYLAMLIGVILLWLFIAKLGIDSLVSKGSPTWKYVLAAIPCLVIAGFAIFILFLVITVVSELFSGKYS